MTSKCFINDEFRFCIRCDILWDLSTLLYNEKLNVL